VHCASALQEAGTTVLACGAVIAAFGFALRAVLHLATLPEAERQIHELAWTWMRVGDFSRTSRSCSIRSRP